MKRIIEAAVAGVTAAATRDLLDNLHLSPEPGWVHVTEERVKLLREALAGRKENQK